MYFAICVLHIGNLGRKCSVVFQNSSRVSGAIEFYVDACCRIDLRSCSRLFRSWVILHLLYLFACTHLPILCKNYSVFWLHTFYLIVSLRPCKTVSYLSLIVRL
uniref:Secreted protein n=1 Tax=Ascaris lumbricoides TaxID=6252 RepID=A0A0M3HGJ4_ASCLU